MKRLLFLVLVLLTAALRDMLAVTRHHLEQLTLIFIDGRLA